MSDLTFLFCTCTMIHGSDMRPPTNIKETIGENLLIITSLLLQYNQPSYCTYIRTVLTTTTTYIIERRYIATWTLLLAGSTTHSSNTEQPTTTGGLRNERWEFPNPTRYGIIWRLWCGGVARPRCCPYNNQHFLCF